MSADSPDPAKALATVRGSKRKVSTGRPTLLVAGMHDKLVSYIKAGNFAWVAAVRAGVTPATYFRWMMRGKAEWMAWDEEVRARAEAEGQTTEVPETPLPAQSVYASLWYAVTLALGEARGLAEEEVFKGNKLAWLTKGPGRDRPGEPGWTETSKVELTGQNGGPLALAAAPQYDLSKLSADELEALETITAKCLGSGPAPAGPGGEGAA